MTSENKYVAWNNLGTSGLRVSKLIIGCMQYGSRDFFPWVEDDEEKIFKILKKAYDRGIRTYDTANIYSNGLSEIILGKFLKKYNIKRDKVVILTKVFFPIDEDYGPGFFPALKGASADEKLDLQNAQGLSRKHIFDAVDDSLRRLGVDYIDVYQIHRLDTNVSKEEIMRSLNDIVQSGKVRYIGSSSMRAVDFVELQHIADKNGWHKFINVQSEYNLLERSDEQELNYYCNNHGVGLTPYSPLARGLLARKVPENESDFTDRESTSTIAFQPLTRNDKEAAADIEIIDRIGEIAENRGSKRATVALAWLIHKGANPIVGLGKEERIDDAIEASSFKLTDSEINYLEEPYKPKLKRIFGSRLDD
ncbi:hypothetical protein WICMUC_005080 [Wickerhamomyces mucosus]|uniref:NADP-dependent oxidoreductase domain-containing protein n=1 Tax=Wickerhamomyces mucosus TaxID=1378264 RepID=A0A9P8PC70_9ASCO|nr:hypothetical protein WICMUC_005080 [Wickerhamomyces mucosus]